MTQSRALLDTPCRAESIKLRDGSHRTKDDQGNLVIKDNPVAIAGVFPFLKSQVDDTSPGEQDHLVYVYRSPESLEKAVDLFRNKPIVMHHKWVGHNGERPHADGTIGSQVYYRDGALYSDLIIYNPNLIDSIEKGHTKQLSPGYSAVISPQQGVYNGRAYAYSIEYTGVNHLGVVTNGRAGAKLSIKDTQDFKMEHKNASIPTRHTKRTNNTVTLPNQVVKTQAEDQHQVKTSPQARRAQTTQDWRQVKSRAEHKHRAGELSDAQYTQLMTTIHSKLEALEKHSRSHHKAIQSISRDHKQRLDDEKSHKAYLDCLQTIHSKLPTFKSFDERNPAVLYRRAYKVMTGTTLQDNLDAETAFKLWSQPPHKVTRLSRHQDSSALTLSKVVDDFFSRTQRL